jgi:PhzF family phenazine biosynthesis protein
VRVLQIDSFTDRPFAGNPAAVVLLDDVRDDAWMQAVAAEMNLAETAFLSAHEEAGSYGLRWFTPTVEVDLCGHATLASAHALWESGVAAAPLRFETRSGWLSADRDGDAIMLDFPADPPAPVDEAETARVAAALELAPTWVGRARDKFIALLEDETTVRTARPDFAAVRALDATGVIVTAPADERAAAGQAAEGPPADFVSRFFAPAIGIDEDPVTGAAHCVLGPFWVDRLGRNPLLGYQASTRGGHVGVAVNGDRVRLSGRAVTVLRGELA